MVMRNGTVSQNGAAWVCGKTDRHPLVTEGWHLCKGRGYKWEMREVDDTRLRLGRDLTYPLVPLTSQLCR